MPNPMSSHINPVQSARVDALVPATHALAAIKLSIEKMEELNGLVVNSAVDEDEKLNRVRQIAEEFSASQMPPAGSNKHGFWTHYRNALVAYARDIEEGLQKVKDLASSIDGPTHVGADEDL